MNLKIGNFEIEVKRDSDNKNAFSASIIFPFQNMWITLDISKEVISRTNLHIEINIDKELTYDAPQSS